MMQVILSNSKHPEYGQATIPFPLAQDQYDDCVELLEKLEIGSATEQDCKVLEISSAFPVLKRMEMLTVNLDELDYQKLISPPKRVRGYETLPPPENSAGLEL